MANATLMRLSRSARAKQLMTRLPVARSVVARFVAGETQDAVVGVAQALRNAGLGATIDRLGEDVSDRAQADEAAAAYVSLLKALAAVVPGVDVSLKLSAMGQALGAAGAAISLENARVVCEAATAVGATVSIDMEDHTTVDRTLGAVHELRRDYPWVAAVVQSGLRRTETDLASLIGPGSRVRLVKGAYAEPPSVAYAQKSEVDAAYVRCLEILMRGEGYPQVATHDLAMVEHAARLAIELGRGPETFEFQMLYGIRTPAQARLRADGYQVRVYVPYGEDWYAYFMRRLAERPANLAFFARALVSR